MSQLLRWYLRMLQKHPWKTQLLSTGFLMGAGDGISQVFIERKTYHEFDAWRSTRFFLLGTFYVGPCLRIWYLQLYKMFPTQSKADALKQMLLDQGCFAPTFIASFLMVLGVTQRKSVDEIKEYIKQNYSAILLTNYKIWPAAQVVNFYLVPIQHRVLFANVVALFWNTYLSWKANR